MPPFLRNAGAQTVDAEEDGSLEHPRDVLVARAALEHAKREILRYVFGVRGRHAEASGRDGVGDPVDATPEIAIGLFTH